MPGASKNFSSVQKYLTGFTLIELLLTISIMSLLSILGVASYRGYNQEQTLESAARDLQSALVLARSRAATQVKPEVTACLQGRELYGYRLDICSDNCSSGHAYELSVVCGESGQYSQVIGKTELLPEGVSFESTTPKSILFRVLTGEVEGAGEIKINGFGSQRKINVSSTGLVNISKPEGEISPTMPSNIFYSLSSDFRANSAEFSFGFSGSSSFYVVDMSTYPDMSWDVYYDFSGGTESPIIATDPQATWDKYFCGNTLYWRVSNDTRSYVSEIQAGTVEC